MTDIVTNYTLGRAVKELTVKTLTEIQVETAVTWANRACAAMHIFKPEDAREYAHEAIEHAALSGNIPLLTEIYATFSDHGIVL
jgi:hypothetical protein